MSEFKGVPGLRVGEIIPCTKVLTQKQRYSVASLLCQGVTVTQYTQRLGRLVDEGSLDREEASRALVFAHKLNKRWKGKKDGFIPPHIQALCRD